MLKNFDSMKNTVYREKLYINTTCLNADYTDLSDFRRLIFYDKTIRDHLSNPFHLRSLQNYYLRINL